VVLLFKVELLLLLIQFNLELNGGFSAIIAVFEKFNLLSVSLLAQGLACFSEI